MQVKYLLLALFDPGVGTVLVDDVTVSPVDLIVSTMGEHLCVHVEASALGPCHVLYLKPQNMAW